MRKRLMSLMLTAAMLSSLIITFPIIASAATVASGVCGDNLTWVLDDSGTLVISGNGDMYNSEAVQGKNGYVSKAPWISEIDYITTLKIENGVTSIGDNSFIKMTNLTNVYLPETLTNIGVRAFLGCNKIKEISLPQNVVNIEANAFSDCTNLTDINLPNGIINIGKGAFSRCNNLTNMILPQSVETIGESIFEGCNNLVNVYINAKITEIPEYSFYKCSNLKTITIPTSIKKVNAHAFEDCALLESIDLYDYVTICDSAFLRCKNLFSISKEQDIIIVPDGAKIFENARKLSTNITIADGVVEIEDNTFFKCSNLKTITFPSTLKTIGVCAFEETGLTSVELPDGLESILAGAFSSCPNLQKVEIPDSVISIKKNRNGIYPRDGAGAILGNCTNLEEVKLGKGFIDCDAVFGCEYGNLAIGSTTNYYPNLKRVILPQKNDVTVRWDDIQHLYGWKSDDFTFCYTGNQSDELSYIDYRDPTNEKKTDIVYIHEINYDANGGEFAPSYQPKFPGENLKITSKIPQKEGYTFKGWSIDSTAKAVDYLPESTYSADETITLYAVWENNYIAEGTCGNNLTWTLDNDGTFIIDGTGNMTNYSSSSVPWYSYRSQIKNVKIQSGVASVGDYAFFNCNNLTSVTIPNTATAIGERTFGNCVNLSNITIPDSILSVGNYAFVDCDNLSNISIGNAVNSIGNSSFSGCDSLKRITIPKNVASIGTFAFSGCDSLETINVDSNNVNYSSIDGNLFNKNGSSLIQYAIGNTRTSYTVPNNVTSIEERAFFSCSNLKNVTICNDVLSIGERAFQYCDNLATVIIGDGVISIKAFAFSDCGNLISVTIGNSVADIGIQAFSKCTSLTNITIPNGVSTIAIHMFRNCTALTRINIPESVTVIDTGAFENCTGLTDVYYNGNKNMWENITNYGDNTCLTNATIHYTYTLTYDANGGKNAPVSQKKMSGETLILSNTYPSREEYEFIGWSIDKNATTSEYQPGDSFILNDDTILYAIWKENDILVTGITLNKSTLSLIEGNSETLTATITPTNATNKSVSWTSSNESVATVSNGTVTAISSGTTIITATTADGGYTATCSVSVPELIDDEGLIDSGIDANGIRWYFYETGLLKISGSGNMEDYSKTTYIPWYDERANITEIVIGEGISRIGDRSFYNCISVQKINIPNSVTEIGNYAFRNCDEITIYGEKGNYAETYANENGIPFINTKEEPLKELIVELTSNSSKWYFDVSVEDCTEEAIVYVAIYDENDKLITLTSDELLIDDINTLTITKDSSASYSKVFVWKNNLQPIVNCETIYLN